MTGHPAFLHPVVVGGGLGVGGAAGGAGGGKGGSRARSTAGRVAQCGGPPSLGSFPVPGCSSMFAFLQVAYH
jgi:hypothetical protein